MNNTKKYILYLLFFLFPQISFAYTLHGEQSIAFHPYKEGSFLYANQQSVFTTENGRSWIAKDLTVLDYDLSSYAMHVNLNQPKFQYIAAAVNDTTYTLFRTRDEGATWVRTYQYGLPELNPNTLNRFDIASDPYAPERVYFWHHEIKPSTFATHSSIFASDDYGTTFQQVDVNIDTTGTDSLFIVPFIGKKPRESLGALYAVTAKKTTSSTWEYTWYRAFDLSGEFDARPNYSFPEDYQLLWFDVAPQAETIFWAIGRKANGELGIFYTKQRTWEWQQAITPPGVSSEDNFMINGKDSSLIIVSKGNIYSIFPSTLQNFTAWDMSPFTTFGVDTSELHIDANPFQKDDIIVSSPANAKVLRSTLPGSWEDISPRWEAAWVKQSAPSPGYNAYIGFPGDTINVAFEFQNRGNVAWEKWGRFKVGLYVYKDPIYSWPYAYNDPTSGLFGQSFFADLFSWGPSANGLTPNSRAGQPATIPVKADETGVFNVTFKIPEDAQPNPFFDDPSTPYDDRYYREDLTVAYGMNWMKNRKNGDPFGNAHIWVPITVL